MVERVEHEILVVALEHAHVWERARYAHDANGVWPAVDHVSQTEHDVICARGDTLKEAIDTAITRWMGWRIDRKTSRETGIPKGLPYLTGYANHYAIMAELPY